MRILGQKLLSAGLVALYGGISLLGYGLHELAPAHQHVAQSGPACHAHAHGCGHDHGAGHSHQHSSATNGATCSDAHECDVCIFLDQMRSEQPVAVADVVWQHLVTDVVIAAPRTASETILGLHVPRGPPTFFG